MRNDVRATQPAGPATQPATPQPDGKRRIAAAVEAARDEILALSHWIHASPEPAFEEHRAAAWCAEVLAAHGFAVELPAGGAPPPPPGGPAGRRGGGGAPRG